MFFCFPSPFVIDVLTDMSLCRPLLYDEAAVCALAELSCDP